MMGPFVDADAIKFNDAVKDFEDKTGIDIQYEGTKEFEATIGVRVDAATPPTSWTSRSRVCWAALRRKARYRT